MKLLHQVKEAGGTATLTFSVKGGKTKGKLEVELESGPASTPPTSSATAPHPRQRRRQRGPAGKAKAAARVARHKATQVESSSPSPSATVGEAVEPSPQSPRRPLHHLPSPADGRRAVTTVGRPAMSSFASLNLDGSPPSLPPRPPPPPPPTLQSGSNLRLRRRRVRSPPEADAVFNRLPFSDRIAILSAKGVGVERYRWQHRMSLRPSDTPPWHWSVPLFQCKDRGAMA